MASRTDPARPRRSARHVLALAVASVSSDVRGLDAERILRVLDKHEVDYVLIDGLAALTHGSTIATADADVLPRIDTANLESLLDAVEELNAAILISERRQAMEAGAPWEATELNDRGAEALASADAWHFTTDAGPIDVVVRVTTRAVCGGRPEHLRSRERRRQPGGR